MQGGSRLASERISTGFLTYLAALTACVFGMAAYNAAFRSTLAGG
jgi:hypothetical protein